MGSYQPPETTEASLDLEQSIDPEALLSVRERSSQALHACREDIISRLSEINTNPGDTFLIKPSLLSERDESSFLTTAVESGLAEEVLATINNANLDNRHLSEFLLVKSPKLAIALSSRGESMLVLEALKSLQTTSEVDGDSFEGTSHPEVDELIKIMRIVNMNCDQQQAIFEATLFYLNKTRLSSLRVPIKPETSRNTLALFADVIAMMPESPTDDFYHKLEGFLSDFRLNTAPIESPIEQLIPLFNQLIRCNNRELATKLFTKYLDEQSIRNLGENFTTVAQLFSENIETFRSLKTIFEEKLRDRIDLKVSRTSLAIQAKITWLNICNYITILNPETKEVIETEEITEIYISDLVQKIRESVEDEYVGEDITAIEDQIHRDVYARLLNETVDLLDRSSGFYSQKYRNGFQRALNLSEADLDKAITEYREKEDAPFSRRPGELKHVLITSILRENILQRSLISEKQQETSVVSDLYTILNTLDYAELSFINLFINHYGILHPKIINLIKGDPPQQILEIAKTGSKLEIVVGGDAHGIIIRTANEASNDVWQEASRINPFFSKEGGSPALPTEIIVRRYSNKGQSQEGRVYTVYSGFTFPTLLSLMEEGGYSDEEIKTVYALATTELPRINNMLIQNGIDHGHPHLENFTIEFVRRSHLTKKDGSPRNINSEEFLEIEDESTETISFDPRVWLDDPDEWIPIVRIIDFDRAKKTDVAS